MPTCKTCGDDVDALIKVKVDGRPKKLCESCADLAKEIEEIAEQGELIIRGMMGFKGTR